jgi:type VI secretion system secreted protein VgrG
VAVLPEAFETASENTESVEIAEAEIRASAGPSPSSVQALKAAARKDVALFKQCGRQADGSCAMAACSCKEETA